MCDSFPRQLRSLQKVRVYDLVGFSVRRVHDSYRIFHRNVWHVRQHELHKENCGFYALCPSCYNFFSRRDAQTVCSCRRVGKISAGRVCNEQIPLSNVMRYAVHRHDLPPLNSLERIPEDVPFGMPTGRLLNIARVGFVSFCSKCFANFL